MNIKQTGMPTTMATIAWYLVQAILSEATENQLLTIMVKIIQDKPEMNGRI